MPTGVQYLNRCVAASASEVEKAPGASVPFYLEQTLVDLEGGRYIGPILPAALADLVSGSRPEGGSAPKGGGGGGRGVNKKYQPMVEASGGSTRVRVCYDAHLPSLSLRDGEQTRSILTGAVLPTLHGHVLFKNWHMCGVCWEDCKRKNSHVPTPPEAANTIAGLLKVARGEWHGCLQPSGGRPSPPPNPQALLGLISQGKSSRRSGVEAKRQSTGKFN